MPSLNVDHTYYKDVYGGSLGEDDFNASLKHAVARVREVIGFNEPATEQQKAAYANAVCAAIEVDTQYGSSHGIGEGLSSLSIGSFSASSGASGSYASSYDADMATAIRRELIGSGLLYQGIG